MCSGSGSRSSMAETFPAAMTPPSTPGDGFLTRAGHELDEIAARGLHALVAVDEHAQRAGGGNLLGLDEVSRDVLGNLAAEEVNRADVRLLHVQVFDDGDGTLGTDGAAHVELAVRAQGQIHLRVRHIAADVALRVGYG